MIKKIILIFLAWRILLFIPLIAGFLFLPYRKGYEYTLLTYFTPAENPVEHPLLAPWANFDGIYYLLIAAKGYTVNAGFFPLFPLIIKILTLSFGTLLPFDPIQFITALVLVSALFLASIIIFYRLVKLDYSSEISLKTILFLIAFPVSFYFASIYTESLFLFLTLAAFYAARRGWWWAAAVAGALLSATRVVGIAIWPALIYEFWIQKHSKNIFINLSNALSLLLIPVGLISYGWYNWIRWGNPLFFVKAQGMFFNNRSVNSLVFPLQTVFRYVKIFLTVPVSQYEWWIALLEFSAFWFGVIFLFIAWRKKVRLSYLIFSVLSFLLPALTGTFSGLPRYVVVLFPIFIAGALVFNKKMTVTYFLFGSIMFFFCLMGFSRGYFIS